MNNQWLPKTNKRVSRLISKRTFWVSITKCKKLSELRKRNQKLKKVSRYLISTH